MPGDRKRRRGGGLGASEAELAALVFGAAPGAPLLEPSAEAAGGGDGEIRNDAGERAATGSRDGAPAWVDEADADEEVALAGVSRLRKLREREDEDVVGGAEYEQRLRQQCVVPAAVAAAAAQQQQQPLAAAAQNACRRGHRRRGR